MEKTIIITGVNGFIGSHMAQKCLQAGYWVIGIDIVPCIYMDKMEYYQLDLLHKPMDEILKQSRPYALIHCAGLADVNYSMKYPDRDFDSNVVISRNILYSLKNYSAQTMFLFLSSAGVYGNPDQNPIDEYCEKNPISPYALHKAIVEDMCEYFVKQHDMDIRILRVFSAYGAGLKKQLFWDMGQKVKQYGRLELFGTGAETRDYIYIDDLVRVIQIIMHAQKEKEIIYNIANGIEVSIRRAAEIFADKCGMNKNAITFSNQTREGNPVNWCANIDKLKTLGYKPEVDIDSGIGKYVEWLKQMGIIKAEQNITVNL